jgi:hypothetical protein
VLEHKGVVTGMITTAGYRDITHIGWHQRPQRYSIRQEVPSQDRPLARSCPTGVRKALVGECPDLPGFGASPFAGSTPPNHIFSVCGGHEV